MRYILIPIGSGGDVFPFLGLALTLRQRGHDVQFITNGHFRSLVEHHGLPFHEFGTAEQYRQAITNPDIWHPTRALQIVLSFTSNQRPLYDLLESLTTGRTVIIAHTLAFAARVLQETRGVPVVSIALQPAILRSVHDSPVLFGNHGFRPLPRFIQHLAWSAIDALAIDPLMRRAVGPLRKELGLPNVRHYLRDWIPSPLLTVGLFPAFFADLQPDWPRNVKLASFPLCDRFSHRQASEETLRFVEQEHPIVFTPGTGMTFAHRFFASAIQAAQSLGRPALLLTGHPEQLPPTLPPSIRHDTFAPLSAILAHCAALIHHGGIGTTAAALGAGIPQLIMPLAHDQPDNAARVVRNGWGKRLWPRHFTPNRLTPLLRDLLADATLASNCQTAAQTLAQSSGLSLAADQIEAVATGH